MRAIATDMDNTLTYQGSISERNLQALKKLNKAGIEIILATGRYPDYIKHLLEQWQIKAHICALNGAHCITNDDEIVYDHPLTQDEAQMIQSYIQDKDVYYHFYSLKGIFTTYVNENFQSYSAKDCGKRIKFPLHLSENIVEDCYLLKQKPYKYVIIDPSKRIRLEEILSLCPGIHSMSSFEDNYELFSKQADKATGIRKILNEMNISEKDLVIFGDYDNDRPMFEMECYKIAMGNATEEIKKRANEITDHCLNDGFALAIEKLLGEKYV